MLFLILVSFNVIPTNDDLKNFSGNLVGEKEPGKWAQNTDGE
jgi:hypothetical protein